MKKQIEIEDSLNERVETAIDEVKAELLSYLDQNPDTDKLPDLGNDLDYSGAIHEIVDGSVPIYTSEIEATWFLHGSELEEAYENAGCGNNPRENDGMAAIYFYIDAKVREWYDSEAQEVFEEWKEKQPTPEQQELSEAITAHENGEFDGLAVADLSEVPDDYEGAVLHINDHGNVTLYAFAAGEAPIEVASRV